MKCEVREICGNWALDINNFNGGKITIYFNSRQNALNVKRILEVDDSIPNAATVCDMQEVKRGEWIYADGDVGYNVYRCSKCGKAIFLDEEKIYNYCPNCGAKMDGERKDEE